MSITTTQGFIFKLVANGQILDLFADEEIKLSDNVTGLFDLGILPADFTRQITLPGSKKNNAFFEHYYDISVFNPDTFSTNIKVPAYFDFDGLYLAQGYLQLNKVNVLANKFIDSYEISIYGSLSSFARDISRSFLTDMTSSLAHLNHTASLENITGSWAFQLHSGSVVYPMAEYGQKILYTPEDDFFGIDSSEGSMFVQDYKPSVRIKEVWDAIFNEYGFTYSGDFWNSPFLNNVYMVCNNSLRYPIFEEINLETYGQGTLSPVSGSTNITLTDGTALLLPWYNIQKNPANAFNNDISYNVNYPTKLRGELTLNFKVTKLFSGKGVPSFELHVKDLSGTTVSVTTLVNFNRYFDQIYGGLVSQNLDTETTKYTLSTEFNTAYLPSGSYKFAIEYNNEFNNNFSVTIDPDNELKSTLSITKAGNVGEGFVINIGKNMPFGTNGIKKIDFITGIQKKFNLVMYPSKTKQNEFIVESFNKWYKEGEIKNFNKYINLDEKLEVIPANNLAVNELNFGDRLDNDYVSQQFSKATNREYGKQYYIDTQNFFSQGKFEVESAFASSPLTYLAGTGVSGSQDIQQNYEVSIDDQQWRQEPSNCGFGSPPDTIIYRTTATVLDANGNPAINFGSTISVTVRYTFTNCSGGTSLNNKVIIIPYGASTVFIEYPISTYVDCGGASCVEETEIIDCVVSIANATLSTSSPISAC
jgi:hypothetical protein